MNMKKNQKKLTAWVVVMAMILSAATGFISKPAEVRAEEIIGTQEEISTENLTEQPAIEKPTEETTTEKSTEESATENPTEEPTTEKATEEPTTEQETPDPKEYNLIAHRGYSGYAPENSMPAFEKAVAAGFKTIELDVIRCKPDASGKATWVLSHNNSLKNTMGVDKDITDLTYSQILKYSYTKGNNIAAYSNLKIVSFEQILQYIKKCKDSGNPVRWQIEIKAADVDNYTQYFEEELVKPVLNAGVEECVSFSSFHYSYLKQIKAASQDKLKTWFLSTILDEDALDYAQKCKAEGISFKGTTANTSKEMIDLALQKGFRLGAYTINSTVVMGVYYQWGVRNFATDNLSPMDVSMEMLTGKYSTKLFSCTLKNTSYDYDNTRKLPDVTVTYKGEKLIEGRNYTLSYTNNKNPGTATVYISGINNCKDEVKQTYKIVVPKVKGFKIKKTKATSVTMSWDKAKHATGYIVYQYNYSKKKYVAIKTISKNTTTSYKAKKLSSATKYKFRVKAYVQADKKTHKSSACSAKTTYTTPVKAKITSVKRYQGYKRLKVKWAKHARCTGYQVKISTDKAMKKVVGSYYISGKSKNKIKIKKLSAKKTYYVKVRAYLKNGKTKIYGAYSSVKKSKGQK